MTKTAALLMSKELADHLSVKYQTHGRLQKKTLMVMLMKLLVNLKMVSSNGLLLVIAGLLVGFGAVMGNGCTSGHGVCGISRGSARSIAATMTFMATASVTVFVLRHVVGG